jgi:hypothetical protein
MLKKVYIASGLLVILLMGCQNSQIQETSIPTSSVESYAFRTSIPDTATLHGKLLVMDPDNAMPASNDAIYLVPLSADQQVIMVESIPFDKALQADVDERTGEFVFTDVQPGKYIIMIVTIYDGQMLVRTLDGNFAVIDVNDLDLGQTIELDSLKVP